MTPAEQLRHTLRKSIGRPVRYHGVNCTVVEILESEPALVLQAFDQNSALQDDQYGDPGRRVAEVFTLPLYADGKPEQIHPDLLRLGLLPLPGH